MNPFDAHCNEVIHIRRKHGGDIGPVKASLGENTFTVFDNTLDVSEGDLIERPLPNGKAERYDVISVQFRNKFHDIPGHVSVTVHKQGSLVPFGGGKTMNVSINNSQGFQVGDNNTQNIVDSFKQVVERIEASHAKPEEKQEAKTLFRKFLEHPITSEVVGKAIEGLLKGL